MMPEPHLATKTENGQYQCIEQIACAMGVHIAQIRTVGLWAICICHIITGYVTPRHMLPHITASEASMPLTPP